MFELVDIHLSAHTLILRSAVVRPLRENQLNAITEPWSLSV